MRSRIFGTGKPDCARSSRRRNVRPTTSRLHVQQLEDRLMLATLPTGFTQTLITTASDLASPTAMEFSPTGQLWILEQTGRAKLVRNDGTTATTLTLSVDSTGERGLLGIAFDPTYDGAGANTDYVYLYYTAPTVGATQRHNRVSRFTVTGAGTTAPTLGSELVLRDLPPEAEDGDSNHNGGATHFGPDGKLYVAVGDHNYDTTPQSAHVSQILTTPFGKMLRLNPDGTNLADNPFYTGSATDWQGSIFAMGLRNPFTFAFQPGSGKMFINDVGESNWEEIDQGQAGANYGWAGSSAPLEEGFLSPPPWPNYLNPVMAYDHNSSLPTPAGVAITGGAFYPAGGQFGNAYAGKYFFSDFGANFIRVFDPAQPGSITTPDTSTDFASGVTAPVDLKLDAAGNLYYLSRGTTGEVFRISSTQPSVVSRQLFYNNSYFDNSANNASFNNDTAIAAGKIALLPGSGKSNFNNVSGYSAGINGIMVDISAGGNHSALVTNAKSDFVFKVSGPFASNSPNTWSTLSGANLPAVNLRTSAGVGGADRIELTWPNGTIVDTWLEVIVKAGADSGLAADDVFYFGSLPGDSGQGNESDAGFTDATDEIVSRNHQESDLALSHPLVIAVANIYDYNKDDQVDATDQVLARNFGSSHGELDAINILVNGPFAPIAGDVATTEFTSSTPGNSQASDSSSLIVSAAVASALARAAENSSVGVGTLLANESDDADRAKVFEQLGALALTGLPGQEIFAEQNELVDAVWLEDGLLDPLLGELR